MAWNGPTSPRTEDYYDAETFNILVSAFYLLNEHELIRAFYGFGFVDSYLNENNERIFNKDRIRVRCFAEEIDPLLDIIKRLKSDKDFYFKCLNNIKKDYAQERLDFTKKWWEEKPLKDQQRLKDKKILSIEKQISNIEYDKRFYLLREFRNHLEYIKTRFSEAEKTLKVDSGIISVLNIILEQSWNIKEYSDFQSLDKLFRDNHKLFKNATSSLFKKITANALNRRLKKCLLLLNQYNNTFKKIKELEEKIKTLE